MIETRGRRSRVKRQTTRMSDAAPMHATWDTLWDQN
jgi:hypothetical protein